MPDYWNVFAHSYFNFTAGTLYQTGRADAIFRGSMDIEHNNWRNYAASGAMLTQEGRSHGGYARVLQEVTKSQRTGPYAADGGAAVICYGINDMGNKGVSVQVRTAFQHALRTVVSRWRASAIYEDSYNLGTNPGQISYGAGFTQSTGTSEFASGSSIRRATSTTSATITITLPADYGGQPVVVCFVGSAGAFGGTVTFSGTAGVTGTLSTSNVITFGSHCPVVRRITGLTAANAGQTIVMTVTAVDASGAVEFDCWWIEATNPAPVIVCNIARLTAAGYAGYSNTVTDSDVATWNAAIADVIAEFDSMVQIADIDAALGKDTALFASDGVHPNEFGAARIADALLAATRRLTPSTSLGNAAHLNVSSLRSGQLLRPRLSGFWYTADGAGTGSNYTAVAGDMFALPIQVTGSRERWVRMAVEAIASVAGTAIRWGIYDDIGASGYPMCLLAEPSSSGAFTITTGAGVKMSPTSGQGSLNQPLDPGVYWLVLKFTTAGTSHTFRSLKGPSLLLPNLSAGGQGNITPSGWKLTGQGTGQLPNTFPAGAALSDSCPYVGVLIN
ncbi:SGNH/GDSL hydrolase family protein [Nonomuraea sp. NPDC047897]|uniref:SGNH/GDSL hydrolase family protein n=1 Tax=Nonomuraea sp. NPDC047897 TaxID=3364346 RepID=UPI00371A6DE2